MTSREEEKFPLPYYAKIEILLRIIDEMKGSKDHRDISVIYRNIKADNTSKIFGLRLGRFLGLVESDTKIAYLTDLGYRFSMLSEEQKKKLLAQNLPSYYVTFLKWIKDSKDRMMDMDSLKADVLNNFKGWRPSSRVLHESLLTFGGVVEYCNFINFIKGSKGSKSRFQLTDNGLQILSGIRSISEVEQEIQQRALFGSEKPEKSKQPTVQQELPREFKYPLRIQTRESTFETDITDEIDWEIAQMVIDKLKTKWQEYQQHQEDMAENQRQIEKEIESNERGMRKSGSVDDESATGESAEDETDESQAVG